MTRRRALLVSLALFAVAPPARAMDWTYASVDAAQYSGNSLAMRLNAQGAKRWAWWTPSQGIVVAGDGWAKDILPGPYEPQDAAAGSGIRAASPAGPQLLITNTVDLALGPDDTPWVAHVRHDCFGNCTGIVRVSHRGAGGWSTEDLGVAYSRPGIAVDGEGRVHVAYGDASYQLEYWVRAPQGGWLGEYVGAPLLGDVSIRLDGAGRPHLAWANGGRLWYAVRVNGVWQAQAVDSGGVSSVNLALLPDGARFAYVSAGPALAPGLWYAEPAAGGWSRSSVAPAASIATRPGIAVDPAGEPRLAFNDQAGLDLRFASRKSGAWTVGNVDTEGNTGYYPVVAFGPDDRPLVGYQADAGIGVRLATGEVTVGVAPAAAASARLAVRALGPCRTGEPLVLELRAAEAGTVTLALVDIAGRSLARLVGQPVGRGANTLRWDAGVAAPGVYFVRARTAAGASAAAAVPVLR